MYVIYSYYSVKNSTYYVGHCIKVFGNTEQTLKALKDEFYNRLEFFKKENQPLFGTISIDNDSYKYENDKEIFVVKMDSLEEK